LELIVFTCTTLHHALLEWQKTKGIHPKASKSKLKADRADCSKYFNYINDGGSNPSYCTAKGLKFLTSPGVADTYSYMMNIWNTVLESYQQRVYNNTLGTVKCMIQSAENPSPAMVTSVEAACVDSAIHLDYWTSNEALKHPEIGSTDPNILLDNNCMEGALQFGMPVGSQDYEDEGDKCDKHDAIPTASWRQRPATELKWFGLGTSDVHQYGAEDGNDVDADEQEQPSQADDGSMQNVQESGHSWFHLRTSNVDGYECQDGNNVDADEKQKVSQADHGSTQNVKD
jgi:hypothetical protein